MCVGGSGVGCVCGVSVHAHGDVGVMDFIFALFSRCSNCFVLSPNICKCKNTHHFLNQSCLLFFFIFLNFTLPPASPASSHTIP